MNQRVKNFVSRENISTYCFIESHTRINTSILKCFLPQMKVFYLHLRGLHTTTTILLLHLVCQKWKKWLNWIRSLFSKQTYSMTQDNHNRSPLYLEYTQTEWEDISGLQKCAHYPFSKRVNNEGTTYLIEIPKYLALWDEFGLKSE